MNISNEVSVQTDDTSIAYYCIAGLSILFNILCAILFSSSSKYIHNDQTKSFRVNAIIHWITCIYIISIMVVDIVLLAKQDLGMIIMIFNVVCCVFCFISFTTLVNLMVIVKDENNENLINKDDSNLPLLNVFTILTGTIGILSTLCINLFVSNAYSTIYGERDIINWITFFIVIVYMFFVITYSIIEFNDNSLLHAHIISCISVIPIILSFHLQSSRFSPLTTQTISNVSTDNTPPSSTINAKSYFKNQEITMYAPSSSYEITESANNIYISSQLYSISNQLLCTINGNTIIVNNSDNLAFLYDENKNIKSFGIVVDSNKIITDDRFNVDTSKYIYQVPIKNIDIITNNMSINEKMNEFHIGDDLRFKIINNSLLDTKTNNIVGIIENNTIFVNSRDLNVLTLDSRIISIDGIFINEEISSFANNKIQFHYKHNDSRFILNTNGIYEVN